MRYHDRLRLEIPAQHGGTTDVATGVFTPALGALRVLYDGDADRTGATKRRRRREDGEPVGPPGESFLLPAHAMPVLGEIERMPLPERQAVRAVATFGDSGAVRDGTVSEIDTIAIGLTVEWAA
jgi:hypothetical protein